MKLLRMKLVNFQGCKEKEFVFEGNDHTIRGDNAVGKTTVANAWCWLLFNRPANLAKNWSPKTIDSNGNEVHNIENSVECQISLDDGSICSIKKLMKEVYSTPKGTNSKQFKGNTIDYEIDSVPVKEKDFNAFIERVFGDIQTVKLLTLPDFFSTDSKENKWDWKSRRELLIKMAGEITDQDIIDQNEELADLNTILLKAGTTDQLYSVEDYQIKTKKAQSELNKKIQRYPDLINEANLAIPELPTKQKEELELEVRLSKKAQENLKNQINSLKNANKDLDKENQILEIKMEERKAREEFVDSIYKHNQTIKEKIHLFDEKTTDHKNNIQAYIKTIQSSKKDVEYMTARRCELVKEYQKVASSTFDEHKAVCPTCGREYDPVKIEELKANFNLDKSKKLEEINLRGKTVSKEAIQEVQDLIDKKTIEIKSLEDEITKNNLEIKQLSEQLISGVFENTDTYKDLQTRLQQVQFSDVAIDHTEGIGALEQKLANEEQGEANLLKMISQFEVVERQKARIEELNAMRERDVVAFEEMERGMYLCQQFIISKVNMINESINKHFTNIQFKMFENNISNEGIKEICDVLVPCEQGLVPYSTANNAAKINAGLEIISVLNDYFKINAPVFVDNAESVTNLKKIDSQVIRLVVDENYKELTMMED